MSRKKVLVVDDNRDLAEAVGNVLITDGFEVGVAHDGHQALQILRQDPRWCLVLLDLMMPAMNGWEFRVQQLQDPQLASIPVVAFSGGVNMKDQGRLPGVAAWLRKPISRGELLALAHRMCD